MRLIDADNYKGKVIASHCYSGVNKVIRIDDVPTVDVNNLIIEELEKIKAKIEKEKEPYIKMWETGFDDVSYGKYRAYNKAKDIINKHIEELKGENK